MVLTRLVWILRNTRQMHLWRIILSSLFSITGRTSSWVLTFPQSPRDWQHPPMVSLPPARTPALRHLLIHLLHLLHLLHHLHLLPLVLHPVHLHHTAVSQVCLVITELQFDRSQPGRAVRKINCIESHQTTTKFSRLDLFQSCEISGCYYLLNNCIYGTFITRTKQLYLFVGK